MYIDFMTRYMLQTIRLCRKNNSQLNVGNTEKNLSLTDLIIYIYIYISTLLLFVQYDDVIYNDN